jgi:glycosyltransferase involved in cell wall biosynthesis
MRSAQPKVSIGLPTYNGGRYLGETLDAILAQSFAEFELVVCDNASTDGTEDICRSYASVDPRIRYVRHERNLGVSRNFNAAFHLATGQYFKWASSDDLIDPTFVERCVRILDDDKSVVAAFSRTRSIGPDGEHLTNSDRSMHVMAARASDRVAYLFNNLAFCNVQYGVLRADVVRRTSLFGNFLGADICFLIELSLHGKFFEVPEFLFSRRFHVAASSRLDEKELAAFFNARAMTASTLRAWRHLLANTQAVVRAPLPLAEKRRALSVLGRRALWDRGLLVTELGQAARGLLRSPREQAR